MRWFGIRVVDASGGPVSGGQMGVRWLMLLVDGMLFGMVGLLAMLLTRRRQRLGDVVADTLVVRDRREHGAEQAERSEQTDAT